MTTGRDHPCPSCGVQASTLLSFHHPGCPLVRTGDAVLITRRGPWPCGSGPWMAYGCARNNFGDLCGLPSWTRQGPDSQWWVHRDDTLDVEWVAYHTDTEPEGCTAWEACR